MDYSPYILIFLEVLIFITLYFQPSESRLYTGGVFIFMLVMHELIFSDYEGLIYHGSTALCYLGIMIFTAPAVNVTRLVLDIHKICIMAIFINAWGWLAWVEYLPPSLYNLASMVLHACSVYVLLKRTRKADHGSFKLDGGRLNFRLNFNFCSEYIQKYKGPT